MKIRTKFNITIIGLTFAGLIILSVMAFYLLKAQARNESIFTADLLLNTILAVRQYTVNNVRPNLDHDSSDLFLAESVPAFSAHQVMDNLNQQFPEYSYREAVFNPTNPKDQLESWEAELANEFKLNRTQDRIISERQIGENSFLTIAKPIVITNPDCLACHSDPKIAPEKMIKKYGDKGGFGWQMHDVIGVQAVTVPMSFAEQSARDIMFYFISAFAVVFLAMMLAFNAVFTKAISRPLETLSKQVHILSSGLFHNLKPLHLGTGDEIDILAQGLSKLQINTAKMIKSLRSRN